MYPAKLLHMREMLGGTWVRVDEITGLNDRLRRLIVNEPGYAGRIERGTREAIDDAYNRLRPFPLPDYLGVARERLILLKALPGSGKLESHLQMLWGLLAISHPRTAAEDLAIGYMRVLVLMSMGLHHNKMATWFGGPSGWKHSLHAAEQECERCLAVATESSLSDISADDRDAIAQLRPFLFINWIQLIAEQAKLGYRRTREEALTLLDRHEALQALRRFLETNHYIWQAAYNGLELASTFGPAADTQAIEFYGTLKRLDPGFESFDYSPGEVPALSDEPNMAYFCERHRHHLHKQPS